MAEAAARFGAEVVVGMPTLGQVFAPLVAEALGHANWVAPGWSRKRWYEEAAVGAALLLHRAGERTALARSARACTGWSAGACCWWTT